MTFLINQIAERRIQSAIDDGKLDDLPGKGKPLELDDDSLVPEELRVAYRILKNAGYLPPELEDRKQALDLCDLLNSTGQTTPQAQLAIKKIRQLELKLRIKGVDTQFIHRYLRQLSGITEDQE